MRKSLRYQQEIAWRLLEHHLAGLGEEECLWRPAQAGLHVNEVNGTWWADWPESESYSLGPPSIAWLTWHIGFWWSMVLNHSFDDRTLQREEVPWPGTVEKTHVWLAGLQKEWNEELGELSNDELSSVERTRWPFVGRPFSDVIAWLNVELMKNTAEIGYCRFLYGVHG